MFFWESLWYTASKMGLNPMILTPEHSVSHVIPASWVWPRLIDPLLTNKRWHKLWYVTSEIKLLKDCDFWLGWFLSLWISHAGGRQLPCGDTAFCRGLAFQTTKAYHSQQLNLPTWTFRCAPSWLLDCSLIWDLQPEAEDKLCPDSWTIDTLRYFFSQPIVLINLLYNSR